MPKILFGEWGIGNGAWGIGDEEWGNEGDEGNNQCPMPPAVFLKAIQTRSSSANRVKFRKPTNYL
ncbi:hypothetical protein [Nostoc sphaeroides]|uniref:hypothetical protein n=1 Tax=Nostoc sphaeroides TaxID=446679 RepID=UPI0015F316D8